MSIIIIYHTLYSVLKTGINRLTNFLLESNYTVAFTGAGVSTASGLPDYRGPKGLWTLKKKGEQLPQSDKPWHQYPPNSAHLAIVELFKEGFIDFLISQNVDGLHLKSGFPEQNLAELHGNSTKMKCTYCSATYQIQEIGWNRKIHGRGRLDEPVTLNQPVCINCDGRLISTIVDFGDPLPQDVLDQAKVESINADLFIVLGSSLTVNPASSLIKLAKRNGATIVIVNIGNTKYDDQADLIINRDVSVLLPELVQQLNI